ncbi:unnamed protein product, partial [Prorocentrum cordatum]
DGWNHTGRGKGKKWWLHFSAAGATACLLIYIAIVLALKEDPWKCMPVDDAETGFISESEALDVCRRCFPVRTREALESCVPEKVRVSHVDLGTNSCQGGILKLSATLSSGIQVQSIVKLVFEPDDEDAAKARAWGAYLAEAAFYREDGHAERVLAAGAPCPAPLLVDAGHEDAAVASSSA